MQLNVGELPNLKTERLHLRSLEPRDAEDLARIAGDVRVAPKICMATIGWPVESARKVIETDHWDGELTFRLAICLPDGTFIGSIGASAEPHIFYFFDPDHWGQGYASEVVQAFVPLVLDRFNLDYIRAIVFQDNPASGKVLERCGFAHVADGMEKSCGRLEPAPVFIYERARKAQL